MAAIVGLRYKLHIMTRGYMQYASTTSMSLEVHTGVQKDTGSLCQQR